MICTIAVNANVVSGNTYISVPVCIILCED